MTEMRAVGFTEFGDPSVLHVVTVPKPSPGPGQVLVRVAAATVNPTDLGFRHGGRALPPGFEPPFIPGMDLAGVIDAVGPEVSGWHAGDRVMAAVSPWVPGGGAQAEYVAVAEDQLARVPDGWSLIEVQAQRLHDRERGGEGEFLDVRGSQHASATMAAWTQDLPGTRSRSTGTSAPPCCRPSPR